MNATVYIFGRLHGSYSQYPTDYTNSIFQKFSKMTKATSQLISHRERELMYYGYIRKLGGDDYIGICTLINGVYLSNIDKAFTLFETFIEKMAVNGDLLQISEEGELIPAIGQLLSTSDTTDIIVKELQTLFNIQENELLPPENNRIEKSDIKEFPDLTFDKEFCKASYTYNYACIYKGDLYDTTNLKSYRATIIRLNKQKEELLTTLETFREKYNKLEKQNKQYHKVAILLVILFFCFAFLLLLNKNLTTTRNDLILANATIGVKTQEINENIKLINKQEERLNDLSTELQTTRDNYIKEHNERIELINALESRSPMIITGVELNHNNNSYTISISYYGLVNERISLQIRISDKDGNSEIKNTYLDIKENFHSTHFNLPQTYTIGEWNILEFIYDGIIIGGGFIN